MRARDVIGRRIARVHQSRTKDKNDDLCWNVHGFTLANGRYVSLSVAELAGDYAVEVTVRRLDRPLWEYDVNDKPHLHWQEVHQQIRDEYTRKARAVLAAGEDSK